MNDDTRADNAGRGVSYIRHKMLRHYNDYIGYDNPSYNQLHVVYDFAAVYSAQYGYDNFKSFMENEYQDGSDSSCNTLLKFFFNEGCQSSHFSSEEDNVDKAFAWYWVYFNHCGWFHVHCGRS